MSSNQSNGPNPVEGYTQGTGTSSSDPFITIFQTRDPTPYDFQYPVKKRWINLSETSEWILTGFSNVTGQSLAIWILLNAGQDFLTLSDNTTPITPSSTVEPNSSGNIQLTGQVGEQSTSNPANFFSTVVSDPSNHSIAINPMSPARWIVDPLGINGTNTTIQGAIDSSSSGDTILVLPGIYDENLVLIGGINIAAFNDDFGGYVDLTGTITFSVEGFTTFSGLRIFSSASSVITVSGVVQCVLIFMRCTIVFQGTAVGINFTNNNINSSVRLMYCEGDISNPNSKFFNISGTNTNTAIFFEFTKITNGVTIPLNQNNINMTPATNSSGKILINNSSIAFAITTSGTASFVSVNSDFVGLTQQSSAGNQTYTLGGSGLNQISNCIFNSGTASSINILTPASALLEFCTLSSSNATGAIIGNGTLQGNSLVFNGSSNVIQNTLTLVTETLGITQSFTPFIAFGGGTTGITYNVGSTFGTITQIGKMVYVYGQIILTSKGISTGGATINSSLLFPACDSTFPANIAVNLDAAITLDAGYSSVFGFMAAGTLRFLIFEQGSNIGSGQLQDTNFSNTSALEFSGWYMSA
jgi:hypothetical protein